MTVAELAERLGLSERRARDRVAAWASLQHRDDVPRVTRTTSGSRGGRPSHTIDAASFERWAMMDLLAL